VVGYELRIAQKSFWQWRADVLKRKSDEMHRKSLDAQKKYQST
jgi:hypothetical protein